MDRLQRLVKKKLEIDLEPAKRKLGFDLGRRDEFAEQVRYWSRRTRLEKEVRDAYYFGDDETLVEATTDLLTFYILYGR